MHTSHLPFSKVNPMIFSSDHVIGENTSNEHLPQQCLYIVAEQQVELRNLLQQWVGQEEVMLLSANTAQTVADYINQGGWKRIVFISTTQWHEKVQDDHIIAFFRLIKALLKKQELQLDIVTVNSFESPLTDVVVHPVDSMYIGFAQTLAKECTEWQVTCASLSELTKVSLAKLLNHQLDIPAGSPLSLRKDKYCYPTMQPAQLQEWTGNSSFKKGGSYLIIGANGGIGGLLARYLAKNYQASLILAGRRAGNQQLVQELLELGASAVAYESLDLTQEQQVQLVLDKHPVIDGIIHSALLLEDASIATMTEEQLLSVLKPKVHGTVYLMNAIRNRQMDFVLFFSSIQSYIANTGQANYTAACVCKDALASLLHHGFMTDTKVINWGFWGNIGIVASDMYKKRMEKLEIGSIEGDEGLAIIERLLNSPQRQITVVKASDRALKRLNITPHQQAEALEETKTEPTLKTNTLDLLEKIVPVYTSESEKVRYNIQMSEALQQYSRAGLMQLSLPERFEPKFTKLVEALRDIPAASSPSREELIRKFPEIAGHLNLVDACLGSLPEILTGSVNPLSVLFPEGSFELVEPVYRNNPIADYFNQKVAEIVKNYQAQHGSRPLRIIEIGAGTGSTTQFVLPQLAEGQLNYTFTDLSFAFLNKAKRRFNEYQFLDYKIYNIEDEPAFEEPFDIVIATNVIHATSDLEKSLSNVYKLLNDGGIFILNEITSCQDYATLTFGLTEGWWLSIDEHRIPNSPLLSGETWIKLFKECGFSTTNSHGSSDQQVITGFKGTVQTNPNQEDKPEGNLDSKQVEDYIKNVIAETMMMEPQEIESDQPFSEYGIDSIISMEVLKPFKNVLGYLPATLLFEFSSVKKLAGYFITEFKEPLQQFLNTTQESDNHSVEKTPAESKEKEVDTVQKTEKAPEQHKRSNKTSNIALVRQVIADVMLLELEDIDDEQPFRELGIDSIISLELLKPLRKQFGYLPSTLLFEYPTVSKLASYLDEHHSTSAEVPDSEELAAATQETELPKGSYNDDDIAIVGMAGQLPQADDLIQFWENLIQGKDCSSELPKERWKLDGFMKENGQSAGSSYTNKGAFINDIEAFDNEFFKLTPLDSERMDPQERLFLQNVYHTILDAGYTKAQLEETETGVFVGVMNSAYAWHTPKSAQQAKPTSLFWSIANRASYFYNWQGPSIAVDTACSSSLTALHTAIRAIQAGDCAQAIVGGVNLIVHPRQYELLCGMHMLSRSERCKPFGKGADGFVDGEGITSIMVKKYADAVAANDRIYAVVKGSSVNSGGRANGYTAPNPEAQAKLIRKALERADISPSEIAYVEAHGTGTELGDPIEIRALSSAFEGVEKGSVKIGSVKSNIGHLESAAGLSGLIKIILQMQNDRLVPSLHAQEENPHLNLNNTPFQVCKNTEAWPKNKAKIAALSSFGAGGSNAHVILQHHPYAPQQNQDKKTYTVIPLSATTKEGLQQQADALRKYLITENTQSVSLDAIAYMLSNCRDHMAYRLAFVVEDKNQLQLSLQQDISELLRTSASYANPGLNANVYNLNHFEQADALAKAYQAGETINWSAIYPNRVLGQVPLYSFKKNRFWIDSEESEFFKPRHLAEEHQILSHKIVPAAWSVSQLFQLTNAKGARDIIWKKALHSTEEAIFEYNQNTFEVLDRQTRAVICSGEIISSLQTDSKPFFREMKDAQWMEGTSIYENFARHDYHYGKPMQGLQWAQVSPHLVKGCIRATHNWGLDLSPALLDSGMQLAILMPEFSRNNREGQSMVPYHMGELTVYRIPGDETVYCYCQYNVNSSDENRASFDLFFTDIHQNLLIHVKDLLSVRLSGQLFNEQNNKQESPAAQEENFMAYDL